MDNLPAKIFSTPDEALETPSPFALGSFLGLDDDGHALVDFEGNESGQPVTALTCVELSPDKAGCEIAVGFLNSDKGQPIVLGILRRGPARKSATPPPQTAVPHSGVEIQITADEELVLRCGKASITLTRSGKILLSGEYVVSQSFGVNQIQGASVQIN